MNTGQINMPARAERRRSHDFAKNAIFLLLDYREFDQSVIDQDGVPGLHVIGELVVVHFDRFLLRLFCVTNCEFEHVILL